MCVALFRCHFHQCATTNLHHPLKHRRTYSELNDTGLFLHAENMFSSETRKVNAKANEQMLTSATIFQHCLLLQIKEQLSSTLRYEILVFIVLYQMKNISSVQSFVKILYQISKVTKYHEHNYSLAIVIYQISCSPYYCALI